MSLIWFAAWISPETSIELSTAIQARRAGRRYDIMLAQMLQGGSGEN
jgi:hypothetical protein